MVIWLSLNAGSSPLARGAPRLRRNLGNHRGLIPAGAGSTAARSARATVVAAHPRWRGEHRRGTRQPQTGRRLIPAGAGSTLSRVGLRIRIWAHPRWRGEHHDGDRQITPSLGSSPLARGARVVRSWGCAPCGLIPAGAGSTGSAWLVGCSQWAHPRWRGEHTL